MQLAQGIPQTSERLFTSRGCCLRSTDFNIALNLKSAVVNTEGGEFSSDGTDYRINTIVTTDFIQDLVGTQLDTIFLPELGDIERRGEEGGHAARHCRADIHSSSNGNSSRSWNKAISWSQCSYHNAVLYKPTMLGSV